MNVPRLVADKAGGSRFESATIPFQLKEFAPPASPLHVTDPRPAQSYVVIDLAVGWGAGDTEPHPAPAPHMVFILMGRVRITASSGETREFGAGDGVLLEDTSGTGHITAVISDQPAKAVMIRLP
jgi:hypothetical protein